MIRQLLTRRPRHVPCTALPIKVGYSQTPTPNSQFVSWQHKVTVVGQLDLILHVREKANLH